MVNNLGEKNDSLERRLTVCMMVIKVMKIIQWSMILTKMIL